jgi:ketosteroid isomerase-like protein
MMAKFRCVLVSVVTVAAVVCGQHAFAQAPAAESSTAFPPLDQWKAAVVAGDATALKAFYSSDPAAKIETNRVVSGGDTDVSFWIALKARSMRLEIVRLKEKPEKASVIFKAEVQTGLPNGQAVNVTDAQAWQKQGEQWRIVAAERTDAPKLAQPSDMKKNLYPPDADSHADIKQAEEKATAEHKRVLLVFGANWCYDCHVLDLAFHRPDFSSAMAGYVVVHVDLGDDEKKNLDVVKQFDATLNKGIPTLAVAESDGKLVVSQKNGEFEDARAMTPEALLEFLNKWKLAAR